MGTSDIFGKVRRDWDWALRRGEVVDSDLGAVAGRNRVSGSSRYGSERERGDAGLSRRRERVWKADYSRM